MTDVDYKDSLNLPHTDFPMKASLSVREPVQLKAWQEEQVYQKVRKEKANRPKFILHDGPPYANGHLHCGHALNKILKDIIVKSKGFSGYDAPYIPGWDCHGLPIELNVEKKMGKAGVHISASDFRMKCREYAASQIAIQREEFLRLGVFGDWENPYATFDFHYEANIVRALSKIIKNGHLVQGFKPVHWCIDCASALAEAEVEYEDKRSPSIHVAFYAEKPDTFLQALSLKVKIKPVIVPIWTTTPWTLPANEAVALHPQLEYSFIDTDEAYFLIAAERVEAIMSQYGIARYSIIQKALGEHFAQLALKHPFEDRTVPIVLGQHVTVDTGTGNVHTAPAHGPDDYEVGKASGLPLINPVKTNGCYANTVPTFAGMSILKANQPIIDLLKERQVLLHEETINHSYPHCWRHKTPMVFLATPQWFISMEKNGLRTAIIEAINQIQWLPEWGKQRIKNMVETRPDWCISRQRAWGTPLPLFVHKETRSLHPKTLGFLEEVAQLIEQEGIEAWFKLDKKVLLKDDSEDYDKLTDTIDVWFDSGVSHYAVLQKNASLGYPADIYLEGSDQHRGWFNSSITTAIAMYGSFPYKTALTHGYTVDAEGRKLSKSKGNYVALDKLVSQHGADILRLWVASTDYRNEVSISEEIIKRTGDAYRRIRNTARFLLANLFDFNPNTDLLPASQWTELDRFAVKNAHNVEASILKDYEAYHFHLIYQKIHNFCAVDLGSFYLDVIKDRQYTTPKNAKARRACQSAMYHILQALVRWLAPILSFTAEEIWKAIPGQQSESIFLEQWYKGWPHIENIDLGFWAELQEIRDEVNKALEAARQQGLIGSGLAADLTLYLEPDKYNRLHRLGDELRFILITSGANLKPMTEKPANLSLEPDLQIAIAVQASPYEKCNRCWHRSPSVGEHEQHPLLCTRCIVNLKEPGETRIFA